MRRRSTWFGSRLAAVVCIGVGGVVIFALGSLFGSTAPRERTTPEFEAAAGGRGERSDTLLASEHDEQASQGYDYAAAASVYAQAAYTAAREALRAMGPGTVQQMLQDIAAIGLVRPASGRVSDKLLDPR